MRCGDELWAAVWNAGIRVIDVSDLTKPRTIGAYDYHPAIPEPTHTVMPFERPIGGRRIAAAIDEEHEHVEGRLHGFLWIFDVTDLSRIEPLSIFTVGALRSEEHTSELQSLMRTSYHVFCLKKTTIQ